MIDGDVGAEEVESPCVSQRKRAAKTIALSRCTSQARPTVYLFKHSLRLLSAAKLSGKTNKDSVVIVYIDAYPSDEDVCISQVKFFTFPLGSTLWFILTTSRGPGIPCLLAFYHRDTRVVQKAKELEPRTFMDG